MEFTAVSDELKFNLTNGRAIHINVVAAVDFMKTLDNETFFQDFQSFLKENAQYDLGETEGQTPFELSLSEVVQITQACHSGYAEFKKKLDESLTSAFGTGLTLPNGQRPTSPQPMTNSQDSKPNESSTPGQPHPV